MQNALLKKGIIIAEILLFVGINVVSSNENIGEEGNTYLKIFDTPYISDKFLACNHLAYIRTNDKCYEFILNDPGNLTEIYTKDCNGDSSLNFLSGGTWTNDQRWLAVEYFIGELCELYLKSCSISWIGGGGTGLNGLSMDITTNTLYACSSYDLMKINPQDGSQEYVGSFNTGTAMIAIACDADGNLYGWDVKFSEESYLYKIDKDNGEATAIGGMGLSLAYGQDGDFCKIDDILYLAAYVTSPVQGSYLYKCDKETGDCTLVGQFEENIVYHIFTIPYTNILPIAEFNWTPTIPEPGETITFNASKSIDPDGYIKVYEWDWDNDGVFDYKNYSSPIATYIFEEAGYYQVSLRVKDNNFTTNTLTKTVRVGNHPPNPPIIKGVTTGEFGETYNYIFNSSDEDEDNLSFFIKWGDGTDSDWLGPYSSGLGISLNHSWDEEGTFNISAKAKDVYGKESNWSYLDITMPKNFIYNLWLNLLNRFSFLQRMLGD